MRDNKGIFKIMNCVMYYSNTRQSRRIAEYLADCTNYELFDISTLEQYEYDTAVLVFPVYSQNIPRAVKTLLNKLTVKSLAVIATYGKMCHGNVLHEIQTHFKLNMTAAAYVPTKHSYLPYDSEFSDFRKLLPIVEKLNDRTPVTIPKSYKNPFSNVLKNIRHRMGIKLRKNENCDLCGVCNAICQQHAVNNGKINKHCIRCMKCVMHCPKNALSFTTRLPMRLYLRKKPINKLIIYV